MIDVLRRVRVLLDESVRTVDPAVVSCDDAAAVVEAVIGIEKRLAALRVVMAGRAAQGGAWRSGGDRSPEGWLARTSGCSEREAKGTLQAAADLGEAPATEAALRAGEISEQQAAVVAEAAKADPAAEGQLLAAAKTDGVGVLRRRCREVVAAAKGGDRAAVERAIHAGRHLRTWTDKEGAFCGRFRMTALDGARVDAALGVFHDRVFARARAAGVREPADAVHADALVALAEAGLSHVTGRPGASAVADGARCPAPAHPSASASAEPPPPPSSTSVPSSREAPEEEPPGSEPSGPEPSGPEPPGLWPPGSGLPAGGAPGGTPRGDPPPDPPSSPPATSPTARLLPPPPPADCGALLAHDRVARPTIVVNVDLSALERGHTVAGERSEILGVGPVAVATVRSVWSEAVLAVAVHDGPRLVDLRLAGRAMSQRMRMAVALRDRRCVVPGCAVARHLEIHHLTPVADGGVTCLDNLASVCRFHHDQVTHRGAELTGGPGSWRYQPPPGGDEPAGGPFDDGYTEIR